MNVMHQFSALWDATKRLPSTRTRGMRAEVTFEGAPPGQIGGVYPPLKRVYPPIFACTPVHPKSLEMSDRARTHHPQNCSEACWGGGRALGLWPAVTGREAPPTRSPPAMHEGKSSDNLSQKRERSYHSVTYDLSRIRFRIRG
jgi:hypothetical protein